MKKEQAGQIQIDHMFHYLKKIKRSFTIMYTFP